MKKIIATLALALSVPAFAHGPHGYYGGYHHHRGWGWGGWVAPVIVGGVVGYELARPPVYVQPTQPVVIQQNPPVIIQGTNCSPWTQVQNPDGSITTTRTCTQ